MPNNLELKLKSIELSFTDEDKACLETFFPLADSFASILGNECEVVIHSLEDFNNSVVKIVNGTLSERSIGAPITDLGLRVLKEFLGTGSRAPKTYFTNNKDGGLMKCSTVLFVNPKGNPIGMFCINLNLSAPLSSFLESFMAAFSEGRTEKETFGLNNQEVIEKTVEDTIRKVNEDQEITLRNKKKTIVQNLYRVGIFDLKGAVRYTASELGITEHSVYKYVRQIQNQKTDL